VGDRTTHKALSPEKTPFKNRFDRYSPIYGRWLEKDESGTHILYDCEAIAYLRFCHLGHCFMEPDDYHETPVSKMKHFIGSVGLLKC
jgi:hypothetical protein